MKTKPDMPAFPQEGGILGATGGLTKREYFAACALQGILADGARLQLILCSGSSVPVSAMIAAAAASQADHLIAALNVTEEKNDKPTQQPA